MIMQTKAHIPNHWKEKARKIAEQRLPILGVTADQPGDVDALVEDILSMIDECVTEAACTLLSEMNLDREGIEALRESFGRNLTDEERVTIEAEAQEFLSRNKGPRQ